MSATPPIIAFGQQPCGIFPRRFLYAKIVTARRLQREHGGSIVFFYHDSDHDPRETETGLRHRTSGELQWLNFAFENRIQRKYSPLHLKRIPPDWRDRMVRQLPAFVEPAAVRAVRDCTETTVAGFCLAIMRAMGLLEGVSVVRSSDPAVRRTACAVAGFFVDVPYEGEIVRARHHEGRLRLHAGGDQFITLTEQAWDPAQVSPSRDSRLRWMQSVLHCTHYIAGAGEQAYLRTEETPEITFIHRDVIDRADEAWTEFPA
ncbi:MAG: hypothetical protein FJ382_02645 [Verrucomicrobia bacterium]|nr:hypothetical protein [Verrucomicrobiota bacterium]